MRRGVAFSAKIEEFSAAPQKRGRRPTTTAADRDPPPRGSGFPRTSFQSLPKEKSSVGSSVGLDRYGLQ